MPATATTYTRDTIRQFRLMLLAGLTAFSLASIALIYLEIAPLLPDLAIPLWIPIAVFTSQLLAAFAWARRRIPARPLTTPTDSYWTQEPVGSGTALLFFLLEGEGTLAAIWAWLSGSQLCVAFSLLAIVGLAFYSPERLERPAL